MIRLTGVKKRYRTAVEGEWALRGVDLEIERGELACIIGTSGSGKTTLLNLIGGLDRRYEGTVEVDGKDLRKLSDAKLSAFRNQHIGFVFQHFSLLDHLTATENVALPSHFVRGEKSLADPITRAREALTELGLGDKLDEHPNNLSGGQKQRVAIARALLFKPPLLLCDEPTGALDRTTGRNIIELFQALNAEGYTVVIITHEKRVSRAARRIIRIEDGLLVDPDEQTEEATS